MGHGFLNSPAKQYCQRWSGRLSTANILDIEIAVESATTANF